MRDIFGVNYESNEYECDKLMIKEADPKMVKKIAKAIDDKTEYKESARIPKWANTLQTVGVYGGMIASLFVIDSMLDKGFIGGLKERWVFAVITILLFIMGFGIYFYRVNKHKKMLVSPELNEHSEKLKKAVNESLASMNVPSDGVEVDVYGELFKINHKGYKVIGIRQFSHINNGFMLYKTDTQLCFADATKVYAVNLKDIKEIVKDTNKILVMGWNKEVDLKEFGLKRTGFGAIQIKEHYKLILEIKGEETCINIPPYEIEHFTKLLNMEIK